MEDKEHLNLKPINLQELLALQCSSHCTPNEY